jgi:hypothetical protein
MRDFDMHRPPSELGASSEGPPGLDPRLKLALRRRMQERHAARAEAEAKKHSHDSKDSEKESEDGSSPADQAALTERFGEAFAQAETGLAAIEANDPQASQQFQKVWIKLGIEDWLAAFPDDPRGPALRILGIAKHEEIQKAAAAREEAQKLGAVGPITDTVESSGAAELFESGDAPITAAFRPPGSDDPPKVQRPLDPSEIAAAREVFGDSLDYGQLFITRHSVIAFGNTSRTLGNEINLDESCFDQNLPPGTLVLSDAGRDTLIHEMTHAWQFQHSGLSYIPEALIAQWEAATESGSRDAAYDYQELLDGKVPFDRWNPEQQAQFVQEFNQSLQRMKAGTPFPKDALLLQQAEPYIEQIRRGEGAPPRLPMMPAAPTGDTMTDLANSIVD